jgi:lysozyme
MISKKSIDILKRHEGFRQKVYLCTAGKKTIGYGYNLEANPLKLQWSQIHFMETHGVTKVYAEELLIRMLKDIESDLMRHLPWLAELETVDNDRYAVVVNMAYNLGIRGLLNFKNTLEHIRQKRYVAASEQMLRSRWARQVGNRAIELSNIMKGN